MLLGTDELTILRGSSFYGTWQWINSVTGNPENFAGLSASIKIKNIHEDFADVKNTYEVGTTIIEPLDIDNNVIKGRVDISLSKEDTLLFAIPDFEDDRYGESDFYSILSITLSTGEVILQAKVRVVESLESETLNVLLDDRQEAIIINGKLDNILARNDEFIATRDNLIDVVIPNAILTYNDNLEEYNDNHLEKLTAYNDNHSSKLQTINTIANQVKDDKNEALQIKEANDLINQTIQQNKDSVSGYIQSIEQSVLSASDSANNALEYKNEAETFKNTASTKAQEASNSASDASNFAQQILSYTNGVLIPNGSIMDLGHITDVNTYFNTDLGGL